MVYDVYSDEDGLTVTLAPLPNEADVAAFQEAEEALPAGNIEYWTDAGGLVLQLENTVLSSGEIGGDDWLHDFLREQGLEYPRSTPMGAVPGSCPDFEKAAISSDGANTTISLLPGGGMTEYQVTPWGWTGSPSPSVWPCNKERHVQNPFLFHCWKKNGFWNPKKKGLSKGLSGSK